jgi:hypothetical protein
MPAKTLKAFADHGKLDTILTTDGGDAEGTLRQFADSGVDIVRWPPNAQDDGAKSFAACLLKLPALGRNDIYQTEEAAPSWPVEREAVCRQSVRWNMA